MQFDSLGTCTRLKVVRQKHEVRKRQLEMEGGVILRNGGGLSVKYLPREYKNPSLDLQDLYKKVGTVVPASNPGGCGGRRIPGAH